MKTSSAIAGMWLVAPSRADGPQFTQVVCVSCRCFGEDLGAIFGDDVGVGGDVGVGDEASVEVGVGNGAAEALEGCEALLRCLEPLRCTTAVKLEEGVVTGIGASGASVHDGNSDVLEEAVLVLAVAVTTSEAGSAERHRTRAKPSLVKSVRSSRRISA